MANPVFRSDNFAQQSGTQVAEIRQDISAEELERMYQAPSAPAHNTGRVTYNDIIMRTVGQLALVMLGAFGTWTLGSMMGYSGLVMTLTVGGALASMVLGLINAFKSKPSPILISLYSVAQGLFLGGLSFNLDRLYPGVATQAVLGTICVFAVMLALFASGKVRATSTGMKIFMVASLGYAVFALVNFVLMITGVTESMFGLRSGWLGVIIGLIAIGLASYSLVISFTTIQHAVVRGAPRSFAWYAAYGLVVDLTWLYIEILRVLAILREIASD